VRIGSGPAAVNGDEIRKGHWSAGAGREGSESRTIRESEDLPEGERRPGTWRCRAGPLRIKRNRVQSLGS